VAQRARRPKRCLLAINDRLRDLVAEKLKADWSPEQISGWLGKEYPEAEAMRISHETIYRTLFLQARGALKRELLTHLHSRRMMRRARHASTRGQPRGQIKEAVSIGERPPEAEDRAVPGHWEGDLLSGSRNTHIATLGFTVATDVSIYFCDPKSPWQRGTSENTNRLLRQYLPRRTDLSVYDQADLDLIALKLNTRPRKTLGYDTPAATLLAKTVALTG
jgi:IS30 family transposase